MNGYLAAILSQDALADVRRLRAACLADSGPVPT